MFVAATENETIGAPSPIVEGARTFIISDEIAVVGRRAKLEYLQPKRRYMKHWMAASHFWASCVRSVDLLMTYCSADHAIINCANYQIRSGYCDILSSLQMLARDMATRPALSRAKMARARPIATQTFFTTSHN